MSILIGSPQLEKIYDPTNEEDDMVEMEEERLRMREHVMNEVCVCVCVCVCACILSTLCSCVSHLLCFE